jgi:hypothetical protein
VAAFAMPPRAAQRPRKTIDGGQQPLIDVIPCRGPDRAQPTPAAKYGEPGDEGDEGPQKHGDYVRSLFSSSRAQFAIFRIGLISPHPNSRDRNI